MTEETPSQDIFTKANKNKKVNQADNISLFTLNNPKPGPFSQGI
jgi:hypothetical protein